MKKIKVFLSVILSAIMIFSLAACSNSGSGKTSSGKVKVVMWGLDPTGAGTGNKQVVDEFNKTHSNIELVPQMTPGSNGYDTQDLSKLTAAIAAGSPPDVTWLNAPFIMEVASRGALTPLDTMIKAAKFDMSQYYPYTVTEMTFDNHIWGLPWDVDDRLLFYNKDLLAKSGISNPPTTWDELYTDAKVLTKMDNKNNISQVGFLPNYGGHGLYLYSIQNNGKWLSDDGKTAVLSSQQNVEALQYVTSIYDEEGGATKINAYTASTNSSNDPFLTGKLAMGIATNNLVTSIAQYSPKLNYGAVMAPTPTGTDFKTWSGGWAWGIPKGAKHPNEAFEVISWLTTQGIKAQTQGIDTYNKSKGNITVPFPCACLSENDDLIKTYVDPLSNATMKDVTMFGFNNMKYSISLPVSPEGQLMFSDVAQALDNAIYHKMTAQQALDKANKDVQTNLDQFWSSYKPST